PPPCLSSAWPCAGPGRPPRAQASREWTPRACWPARPGAPPRSWRRPRTKSCGAGRCMDELCYRVSEEGDLPGLLRLWEEAGWGRLEPRQWREWFVDGPQGPSLITVAVDPAGEVAALEVFAAARLSVAGREVRALRCSAPILRPDLRGQSLRRAAHPAFGLYRAAAAVAVEHGFEV